MKMSDDLILNVPLVFNQEIIGYSGDRNNCRTIKFINEELNKDIFEDKDIFLIALTEGKLHEDGSPIITNWVAEYKEDVDNNTMKTLEKSDDTKKA